MDSTNGATNGSLQTSVTQKLFLPFVLPSNKYQDSNVGDTSPEISPQSRTYAIMTIENTSHVFILEDEDEDRDIF